MKQKDRFVVVVGCGKRKGTWAGLLPLLFHYVEPKKTVVLECCDDLSAHCARNIANQLEVLTRQIDFLPHTTRVDEDGGRAGSLLESALLRADKTNHVLLCIDSKHASETFKRLISFTFPVISMMTSEATRRTVSEINANEAAVLNITTGEVHKLVG
jgi:hypothetical protein